MLTNLKKKFRFYWWKLFHKPVSTNSIRRWLYGRVFSEDNEFNTTNSGFSVYFKEKAKRDKQNEELVKTTREQFRIIKEEALHYYKTADYKFLVLNDGPLLNCVACQSFLATDKEFCEHELVNDDLKELFKNDTKESRELVKNQFKVLTKQYKDKTKLSIVLSLKYFAEQ